MQTHLDLSLFRSFLFTAFLIASSALGGPSPLGIEFLEGCSASHHHLASTLKDEKGRAIVPVILTGRLILGHAAPADKSKYFIFDRATGQLLGSIDHFQSEEAGLRLPIHLNEAARGRGIGSESKFAVLQYAFEKTPTTVVTSYVDDVNLESMALHQKLGFKETAREDTVGMVTFTLTRADFEKLRPRWEAEGPSIFLPKPK